MMKMDDGISKLKAQRIEGKIAQMRENQEMDAVREEKKSCVRPLLFTIGGWGRHLKKG